MKFRATLLALGLLAATAASTAGAEGNAERGKVLAYTCRGCHGVPNYQNAYPNYSVPKLGGQQAPYLISALKAYASGARPHPTMHAQASTLSEQELADVAAYLQGAGVQSGKNVVGTPPAATQTCASCHGPDGAKAVAPDYPVLAGQYADYIEHTLRDYKSGKRKNPIMAGIITGVDEKDFPALAAFFAQQSGVCGMDVIVRQNTCNRE